jgi:sigma-B regulation protein RsbU (phosphoserine phosphatase)
VTVGSEVEDASTWRELVSLAVPGRESRALLDRLAEELVRGSGLDSVAVYVEAEGFRRRLQVGPASFPARATAGESDVTFGRFGFPGGLLLYSPASVPAADLDHRAVLTLSCALRAVELGTELKRQSFAASYRGVELQSLYEVGLAIARMLELEDLREQVLLRAVSLLDARVGALYLYESGYYRLEGTFGGEAVAEVRSDDPRLAGLTEAEKGGAAELISGAQHTLAVSIEADGTRLGLLVVGDKENRQGVGAFLEEDRRMLELFGNQVAIALENARLHKQALEKERLERELDLAADIQRQLLPTRLPEVEGFEFAGWNRPARHVGGDYYDLRSTEDGGVHLVLGDVTGKGMPAALLVSTLHSALRLLLSARPFDAELFQHLNRHIAEASGSNKFITMAAAKLDPATGHLDYVNAGHNPPLLVRAGGEVVELPSGGMPLGMFAAAPYQIGSAGLEPGDLLCIFSDGITECESPEGEEFGPERLAGLLKRASDLPLPEIVRAIDEAAVGFVAGGPQGDDQTVVLARRSP